MSKASTTMRMPSDMSGADKFNPCLECLESWDGWCGKHKTWGFKVKDGCIAAPKKKRANQRKAFKCVETGDQYSDLADGSRKTKYPKSNLHNWLRTGKKNRDGLSFVYLDGQEKETSHE